MVGGERPSGCSLALLTDFVFWVPLTQDSHGTTPSILTWLGLAGITSRVPGAFDPVIAIPQGLTIDPTVSTDLPVEGSVLEGFGWLEAAIAIPNDPSLHGAVALFQMAVDDGTGLILSEIIAVRVP